MMYSTFEQMFYQSTIIFDLKHYTPRNYFDCVHLKCLTMVAFNVLSGRLEQRIIWFSNIFTMILYIQSSLLEIECTASLIVEFV